MTLTDRTTGPDSEILPAGLVSALSARRADEATSDGVDGDVWLRRLPHLIDELLSAWDLRRAGQPRHGRCAIVIPVLQGSTRAALKVTWPHAEARHEHLALRAWDGRGAVRLLAADPSRWALLLEHLHADRDLATQPVLDACETIGALHAVLDRPALPRLGSASAWCAGIEQRLRESPPPVPPRFVDQGIHLAREIGSTPEVDARLVHTDLHDANVLAGDRAGTVDGWLAIDPKPLNGEPAMAIAPLLWNRWNEATRAYHLRNHLRFRVDYACDAAGIDPEQARRWTILRLLDNAWWAAREGADADEVTRAVAIIKAMQD